LFAVIKANKIKINACAAVFRKEEERGMGRMKNGKRRRKGGGRIVGGERAG